MLNVYTRVIMLKNMLNVYTRVIMLKEHAECVHQGHYVKRTC